MRGMVGISRRDFVGTSAALAAFWSTTSSASAALEGVSNGKDPWGGLKVGIATYTFSKLPLDEAIKGTKRVGVNYVSLKEAHLPLRSTTAERKAVVTALQSAGITPLSCGVVNMTDDVSAMRNAFEYARDSGIPTIVCKPTRQSLPALEALVKEFDIRVAIHNHGPEDKVWPSPLGVLEAIQTLDKRVGLCIDVGHTARCGVDPVKAIHTCSQRLYDLHIKDLSSHDKNEKPIEVGRGVLDIPGILKALRDVGYTYHVGLEHEKDMTDPLPGVAESVGYIRGVLAGF